MNAQKGYYSVVQYCPDLSRFEAANIGVLLFCPESQFFKAVTSSNNRRIRQFFGSKGHDWKRIDVVKQAFHERIEAERNFIRTIEDLKQFIATRANSIQITEPRPIKVMEPDADLLHLSSQMIGDFSSSRHQRNLRSYVADQFRTAGVQRKIRNDVKVQVPVLGKSVEIPFGFQNGRFHLINPVRFTSNTIDQTFRTASKYAVEGQSLFKHPDPTLGALQLVIVGEFPAAGSEAKSLVRRVFEDASVKLYSSEELPRLIQLIEETGTDVGQP